MPNYEYVCDNCEIGFELKQSFHDKPKKKCPECSKMKLRRVFSAPYAAVRQEPKKLGHFAARKTEKMGRYEYNEKVEKNHTKKEKKPPWWRKDAKINTKLANLNKKQQQDYIQRGTLP